MIDVYPLGLNLPIRLGKSGYFEQTYDTIQRTKVNLINLLTTRKGERRLNVDFGTDLFSVIFQSNDDASFNLIVKDIIKNDVEKWIPEVSIVDVKILTNVTNLDTYIANIELKFLIANVSLSSDPETVSIKITEN